MKKKILALSLTLMGMLTIVGCSDSKPKQAGVDALDSLANFASNVEAASDAVEMPIAEGIFSITSRIDTIRNNLKEN